MMHKPYVRFSESQLSKIGNTVIYLANHIPGISKTKLLKLLYILDELSIRKSGIPFLNLKYKVWKFGPVSEELFVDLSSEISLLKGYIQSGDFKKEEPPFVPVANFSDDEFSDNDIELMNLVITKFGEKSAKELVSYTHRKNSPWYQTAVDNSVLELLEREEINNTEFFIDLSRLIAHDERKMEIYSDYVNFH